MRAIWLELAGSRPHLSFALKGEADVIDRPLARRLLAAGAAHPSRYGPCSSSMAGEHNLRNACRHRLRFGCWGAVDAIVGPGAFRAVKGRS